MTVGERVPVPGPHDSIMAGLNCGEVSCVAWRWLRIGVPAAITVTDQEAMDAMRQLARSGIIADASGAASLAGLSLLARDPAGAELLSSRRYRTVLLLVSQGMTNPESYRTVVQG